MNFADKQTVNECNFDSNVDRIVTSVVELLEGK